MNLRVASAISAVIFALASFLVLARAGIVSDFGMPTLVRYGVWFLVAFFAFNTITNLLSKNQLESMIMTPIVVVLCILCLVVALTAES